MKVIVCATSGFAIPSLRALVEAGYEIVAVITQPDKPAGRKQEALPSLVKLWALEHGLKVFQPESLEIGNWKLEIPEINIVASYGKLIPKWLIDAPKFGSLNIHPSLLPKYRGPSPIQAAILNGDEQTGVTIIKLDQQLDHGPIVSQSIFNIPNSIFYKDLHDKLANLGAELLIKTIPDYVSGKIKPRPQDHSKATFTKIITKDDARIDWSKPSEEIDRLIRAYSTWPVAWTMLDGKRLKIFQALPTPLPKLPHQGEETIPAFFPPLVGGIEGGVNSGTILINGSKFFVQTTTSPLEILSLQLEGSKKMPAAEFLRGQRNLQEKIFR